MLNKFSFNIYHSPITFFFQRFKRNFGENYGEDQFCIFYQEFKFFIVAIKYDVGHF
jgi:hypothetical protein